MFRILATLFFVTILTGCNDVVESEYASYNRAKEAKLFKRSWLPDIIPKSSFNIKIKTDLDANTANGTFSFDERDLGYLETRCKTCDRPKPGLVGVACYHFKMKNRNWYFYLNERDMTVFFELVN